MEVTSSAFTFVTVVCCYFMVAVVSSAVISVPLGYFFITPVRI